MRWAYINAAMGIPLQGPSGASAHIRELCTAMSKTDEIRIYTALKTDRRGLFGEELEAFTVPVMGWPSWLKKYRELREIITARRISGLIHSQNWRPDVILERHSLFSDAAWRASDQLGVPWVLEVNAPIFEERKIYENLSMIQLGEDWQRDVLLACPMIFAVSQWLQQWLSEEIGCQNVHWLPNGANEYVGDPVRGRRFLGVSDNQEILGFVGSMRPWQGADRVKEMARKLGMVSVCIGAATDQIADIQKPIYDPAILADIVSAFTVAVAPYTSQAPPWLCPLKLFQYRSQGVPVVCADVGDSKWIVGSAGSVISPSDDSAFIEAIDSWRGVMVERWQRSWHSVANEMRSQVHGQWKTGYHDTRGVH